MRYDQFKSRKQEKKIAKQFKARVQPGSGCGPCNKGDVLSKEFLIEAKITDKNSFRLTKDIIDKIELQAVQLAKEPLICIQIQNRTVYVMTETTFDLYCRRN